MRPIVLTIAGADPSGGAGIQADIKAIEASGGYGASAITAITVQNTLGVRRVQTVEPDLVREQLRAVLDDLEVAAVKSGMLGERESVAVVADLLREERPHPYVLDPVVASGDGFRLLDEPAIELLKQRLAPLATLLTPNVDDVHALTGLVVRSVERSQVLRVYDSSSIIMGTRFLVLRFDENDSCVDVDLVGRSGSSKEGGIIKGG